MYAALVGELRVGELGRLRRWLEERHVGLAVLSELPMWNSSRLPEMLPNNRRLADRSELAVQEVSAQLPALSATPDGAALLLLYLLLRVEEEWQTSYHYRPLWDTLRGAGAAVRDRRPPPGGADPALTRAVLALMDCLDAQIVAENAMTTGELTARETALEAAVAAAREAAVCATDAAAEHPDVSGYVVERAVEYELCCAALAAGMRGIRGFFDSGEPLDPAIRTLGAAEEDRRISDDGYRSTLRAERFTLTALNRRRQGHWLRIDRGRVVHLYPFAVRGLSTATVVSRVAANAQRRLIAGVRPKVPYSSMNLDDVWDGSDALGRRYDGVLVELPDVLITGTDGRALGRAGAQIRFSTLGNHYVRFESGIEDATPADLYAAMFRAAPEHGSVHVSFEGPGDQRWPRLADLAVQLAEEAGACLQEPGDTARVRTTARQGMFQTVLTVDAASTTQGPARTAPGREVATVEELVEAVGAQVLTNPVNYCVGTAAEWIRYATANQLSRSSSGLAGTRTVRTSNTTVVIALGAPGFTQDTSRSLAEFAASLDGLFEGWSLELALHFRRVRNFQHRVDAAESDGSGSGALSTLSRELDAEKIRLDDFAANARSTIALIGSPSLVASPVAADSLRVLLGHSDFPHRVTTLNAQIEQVAHEQLVVTIEKLAQQRREQEAREQEAAALRDERLERAQRAKLEMFLAVIAAAGISGVVQVLQAGFFEGHAAAGWAVVSVAVIVSLSVALGFLFRPTRRRRP